MHVDVVKNVKHPCQGCVYFDVCGNTARTEPCKGRQTKTEQKKTKRLQNNVVAILMQKK